MNNRIFETEHKGWISFEKKSLRSLGRNKRNFIGISEKGIKKQWHKKCRNWSKLEIIKGITFYEESGEVMSEQLEELKKLQNEHKHRGFS